MPLNLERNKGFYTPCSTWVEIPNFRVSGNKVKTNFVSYLKVKITWFRVESQVDSVTIITDDIFCSRVLAVSSPHKFLKSAQLKGGKGDMYTKTKRELQVKGNLVKHEQANRTQINFAFCITPKRKNIMI